MARTNFTSVDHYIAAQPDASQKVLERVRATIRTALPAAEEGMSYQIPAYKLNGRLVLYFAGWREHYSLYPATTRVVAAFQKELAPYEVNSKGTVRFPLTGRIPVRLIAGIARFRAKDVAESGKSKAAAKQR